MSISFMLQKWQSHRHLCPCLIFYHCSFKIGTVFHTETSLSNGFRTFHTIYMASSSYTTTFSVLSACPHWRSLARKALPTPHPLSPPGPAIIKIGLCLRSGLLQFLLCAGLLLMARFAMFRFSRWRYICFNYYQIFIPLASNVCTVSRRTS